jgi:hypothetical protein
MTNKKRHIIPALPVCRGGCGQAVSDKGRMCTPCKRRAQDQRIRNGR